MLNCTCPQRLCLVVLSTLFLLTACSEKQKIEAFIQAPIPQLDPSFEHLVFDAEKGLEHQLANGGHIRIPPNALINELGEVVTGKVEAKYREFHEVGTIFLAGIPMSMQTEKGRQHFQTAGSFQLEVQQNGKDLQLRTGQQAQVKMASWEKEDNYDFYFLDENQRAWTFKGTAPAEVNKAKLTATKQVKKMRKGLPFPLNRRYLAFNYNIIVDVYMNDNLKSVNHDFIKDKMEAYGLGWADIEVRSTIDYQGKKIPAGLMLWRSGSNNKIPDWTNKRYAKMEQVRGKRYRLSMYSKDSSQHFSAEMDWVMPLKSLFAFSPEEWVDNYQANIQKIEAEQQRIAQMAEAFRTFELAEFGIYNWDRLMKEEERVELMAHFDFDVPVDERLNAMEIFYVSGDNKSLIRLQNHAERPIALVPDPQARIFSILPNNRLALITAEEYALIDFAALRKEENPEHRFLMKSQAMDFSDARTFKAVLGIDEVDRLSL
ncbi:MAG: hypothetical protein AAF985_10975 [Bacteroidota bacterium]